MNDSNNPLLTTAWKKIENDPLVNKVAAIEFEKIGDEYQPILTIPQSVNLSQEEIAAIESTRIGDRNFCVIVVADAEYKPPRIVEEV